MQQILVCQSAIQHAVTNGLLAAKQHMAEAPVVIMVGH
jgi:hypothetical protein